MERERGGEMERERKSGIEREEEEEEETHLQDGTHGVCSGSSQVGAELVESLQVGLAGHSSNTQVSAILKYLKWAGLQDWFCQTCFF